MDASTGAIGKGFNSASAYQQTFGYLNNETRYHEGRLGPMLQPTEAKSYLTPVMKSQQKMFIAGFKALTSTAGGVGTAGYGMVPVYVDPRIVDTTRKYTPLVEMIPRVTNQGKTADFNTITAKGGAITAVEDAALTASDDTYARTSVVQSNLCTQ